MAATLRIPDQSRKALAQLGALTEPEFLELLEALRSIPPSLLDDDVLEPLLESVSKDAKTIVKAVLGLHYAMARSGKFVDEISREVVKALKGVQTEPSVSGDHLEALKLRVGQLLAIEALRTSTKALNVQQDEPHVYENARVLTDIRPVFLESVQNGPLAAVICHTLKLEYRTATGGEAFFVTLDNKDLEALSDILERAAAKEQACRDLLAKANLRCVTRE